MSHQPLKNKKNERWLTFRLIKITNKIFKGIYLHQPLKNKKNETLTNVSLKKIKNKLLKVNKYLQNAA